MTRNKTYNIYKYKIYLYIYKIYIIHTFTGLRGESVQYVSLEPIASSRDNTET